MKFHLNDVYSIFGTPTYFEGEGGGGGGNADPPKPDPPKKEEPETVPKDKVDSIVQQRIEETRRKAIEDVAKDLGMSVEDAKKIIEAKQKADDAEKSEAQLAREAADREKAEAATEKSEAANARHTANVERAVLRALPADMDDAEKDKKVERISRLIDVEVGADAEKIGQAVKALKDDDPSIFGAGTKKAAPPSDPKGGPPKNGASSEDGFTKGQERAKAQASSRTSRSAFKADL